ncbi:Uncharacterised protein [Vibrio cholerae]|nr:Uncharacterised protein [Vibrio cholerae]CSD01899.1 Uncharacterised protein [Vibrio cholerae]
MVSLAIFEMTSVISLSPMTRFNTSLTCLRSVWILLIRLRVLSARFEITKVCSSKLDTIFCESNSMSLR